MSEEIFDAESSPEFTTITEPIRNRPDLPPRVITAAAQVLSGPTTKRIRRTKTSNKGVAWQLASWEYYDEIGEYSWAVELLATHLSKVQLVAARDVPGLDEPVILDGKEYELDGETIQPSKIDQDAADLIAAFAGGTAGQQQLLYRGAVQEIVAAESFIVGRQDENKNANWDAYSNEEIKVANGKWTVDDGTEKFEIEENDVLIRVWRPHPRKRSEPRSSARPLLPILAEIKGLTQAIGARIDSRLAGAGILFVPESAALLGANGKTQTDTGENLLISELLDSMLTPIRDRDSAAAVVPIVVTVPDDSIEAVKHIRFDIETKAEEAEQRRDAVGRLAATVDLPREQVEGMSGMNHWGAWQADEATVKGPVATLAAIFAHAFTVGYLRPGLLELGHDELEVAERLVWYDLTALIQRPDRSEQALQVWDRDGIGYAALLRESGFDEADAPTEEDTCRKLLFSLIESQPAQASTWLRALGPCANVPIDAEAFDLHGDGSVMSAPSQPGAQPQVQDLPENNRELPAVAASVVTEPCPDSVECLYATCELAVLRALELAGKRMRGSSPRNERAGLLDIADYELHTNPIVAAQLSKHGAAKLLEHAWAPLQVALPGRTALVADLNEYATLLLERRESHNPEWLRPIVARHA